MLETIRTDYICLFEEFSDSEALSSLPDADYYKLMHIVQIIAIKVSKNSGLEVNVEWEDSSDEENVEGIDARNPDSYLLVEA